METRQRAKFAAKLAGDKKAEDLVILDMRKTSNFCDYFVICSASSNKQTQAIADAIEEGFLEKGIKPIAYEGKKEGSWVLLYFGGVMVHIFCSEVRSYYNLERLWIDAPRIRIPKN